VASSEVDPWHSDAPFKLLVRIKPGDRARLGIQLGMNEVLTSTLLALLPL